MQIRIAIPFLSAALFAAGCGPDDGLNRGGELAGVVRLDGQPLGGGRVEIFSADGRNRVSCDIRPDGGYTLREPPLGECKLTVTTEHLRNVKSESPGMTLPKGVGLVYVQIPARYGSVGTSDQMVVIVRGKQNFDIHLRSK